MTATAVGDSDESLARIVRSVLLVARLGETDRCGWWATGSFGPAGRVVLKRRLPRTWRMAAVEIDIAAARNRHDEIIERRNAVHLFSDNWPVRRWTSAWVAEQKTADPADRFFEELESIAEDQIRAQLTGPAPGVPITGDAVRLGAVHKASFADPEALVASVERLAAAYTTMDGLTVPYLEISG